MKWYNNFLIVAIGVGLVVAVVVYNAGQFATVKVMEKLEPTPKEEKVVEPPEPVIIKTEKKTSLNLENFSQKEIDVIMNAGFRNDLNPQLFHILFAIRKAESGRAGREFGVLHPRAINTDLDTQAGWCAATIQKNYDRWVKSGKSIDFIHFLGNRYCPVGAENDPTGLNKHWITNVKMWANIVKG